MQVAFGANIDDRHMGGNGLLSEGGLIYETFFIKFKNNLLLASEKKKRVQASSFIVFFKNCHAW